MIAKLTTIGKYLDREIQITEATTTINFSLKIDNLENSMLFIFIHTHDIDSVQMEQFIRYLISMLPVGIAFWGYNSKINWNLLVDLTSTPKLTKHIMTYFTDEENIGDALKTMFYGFISSEDRWDNWNKYTIISIGSHEEMERIKTELPPHWLTL